MDFLREVGDEVGVKEKQRKARVVTAAAGRENLFLRQLTESMVKVFAKPLANANVKTPKAKGKVRRSLNLIVSDTHFGSNLDPREVGHKYGPTEEARRIAAVFQQMVSYKTDHRDETVAHVHGIGDLFQGRLHDMRDGAPLADQCAATIRYLVQGLRYLAANFREVVVDCTPGNHGRFKERHADRAVTQKWDSLETVVYVAVKEAMASVPNVKVRIYYSPEYYWEEFGHVGMGTHGDTVLEVGYPNKSINVESVSTKVDKINIARVTEGKKPLAVVVTGHVHTGTTTNLPGGTVLFTNSCLLPPDPYAKSKGFFSTACGQWLFESTEAHAVGDTRFIKVDKTTDEDASLDKIVSAYEGFDR